LNSLQTDKPLGAEKIELELLENQKLAKEALNKEEVKPSSMTSEAPDTDSTHQQDVINFFKSDEQLAEQPNLTTTAIELPVTTEATAVELPDQESTSKSPNRFLLDSDNPTIKPVNSTPQPEKFELEKLVEPAAPTTGIHSNGIYQHISTVELKKLDEKSPRIPITTPSIQLPTSAETTLPISEATTLPTNNTDDSKPLSMVEAVEKMENEIMSPTNWQKENEKLKQSKCW
jgi:hypothetical protein